MNKLLIALMVVFFFSCENSPNNTVFPTEPQAAFTDGNQEIMARRTPPEPNFEIIIKGSVFNWIDEPYKLYKQINKGSNHVSTPDQHHLVDMNMKYFSEIPCFNKEGPYASYMQIKQMDKKNPENISIWFWFDAKGFSGNEATYILQMEGTFDFPEDGSNWPPAAATSSHLTFKTWSFTTEGNIKKYKDTQCDLSGLPASFDVTVTVKRIS